MKRIPSSQGKFKFDEFKNPSWRPDEPPSLDGVDEIGFDTETTGLKWWDKDHHIGTSIYCKGRAWYLPTGHAGGNIDYDTWKRWAQRELRGKKLVTLNGPFDAQMYYKEGIDLEAQGCTITDVGHSAALLDDHRVTFNLEGLGQDYLGVGKIQGLDKTRMASYHAGEVAEYAMQDAELVVDIRQMMVPRLIEQGLMEVQDLEDELIWATAEMVRNGCLLDEELLTKWVNQAEQELYGYIYEIKALTGLLVNPKATGDTAAIFDSLGVERPEDFQAHTLEGYVQPAIVLLRKARQLESLKSKFLVNYLDQMRKTNHILRYALHQLRSDDGGTVSGRYSSSALMRDGAIGVNIQQVSNVKKQIKKYGSRNYIVRRLFRPRKGYLWLAADAKQIEYRLFAHYAKNPEIIAAYEKDPNIDYHNFVMSLIQRVKPDITRELTKDVNFARIYGAGTKKIAEMLRMSYDDARTFLALYDQVMPEIPRLLRRAQDTAEQRGYVMTLLGRRARFPGGNYAHKGFSRVNQGSAADVAKKKTIELHKERKRTGFLMRLTLHDAVDGDVPDKESARMVAEILDRQSIKTRVPILWDVKTGTSWAHAEEPKIMEELGLAS